MSTSGESFSAVQKWRLLIEKDVSKSTPKRKNESNGSDISSDGSEEQQERPDMGQKSKKAKKALFNATGTAEALRGLE